MIRIFASRRFFVTALTGLVLVAVVAMDVPQGVTDRETVSTYPLSMGPYVALFGLNQMGSSLLVWFWILLMALHAVAVFLAGRVSGAAPTKVWSRVPSLIAAVLALAGLLVTGLGDTDPRTADTTRLSVMVSDTRGGQATQIVEEGASYQVPAGKDHRTLSFGVGPQGPYAFEKTAAGLLRAHLPVAQGDGPSDISVHARRPRALSASTAPTIRFAPALDRVLDLAVPFFAFAVLALALRRTRNDRKRQSSWALIAFLLFGILLAANPLWGPGSSWFSTVTGDGKQAWFSVLTATASDAAPWTAHLPAMTPLAPARLLVGFGAVFAVLAILFLLMGKTGIGGLVSRGAGFLLIGAGITDVAYALGRIPVVKTAAELHSVFRESILPRIDMTCSVLGVDLSGPGPFTISVTEGLSAGLALMAVGLVLSGIPRPEPRPGDPLDRRLTAVLTGLLCIAALRAVFHGFTDGFGPLAVSPLAMLALLLASLPAAMAWLHPRWPEGVLITAVVAAVFQLALI